MNDLVNLAAFKELEEKHLLKDIVDIIRGYSELPSYLFIGNTVFAIISDYNCCIDYISEERIIIDIDLTSKYPVTFSDYVATFEEVYPIKTE